MRLKRYKPYSLTRPPAGTYDPALDSQVRGAQRGLQDLTLDTERQREQGQSDYQLARGDAFIQGGNQRAQLLRGVAQGGQDANRRVADLRFTANQSLSDLARQFRMQASAQNQAIGAAGLDRGGAGHASAVKRQSNQGFQQQRIASNLGRSIADVQFARQRQLSDAAVADRQLRVSADRAAGRLALNQSRREEGLTRALTRARREQQFFNQDVGAQRFYQAAGDPGYVPPARPRNEHTAPVTGRVYRTQRIRGKTYYVLPNGQAFRRPPR